MDEYFYVYILASQRNGTLYVGVTSNLIRRVYEHKQRFVSGFTKQYGVHTLVHYEQFEDIQDALAREKQLKKWERAWKIKLIEKENKEWQDLFDELV